MCSPGQDIICQLFICALSMTWHRLTKEALLEIQFILSCTSWPGQRSLVGRNSILLETYADDTGLDYTNYYMPELGCRYHSRTTCVIPATNFTWVVPLLWTHDNYDHHGPTAVQRQRQLQRRSLCLNFQFIVFPFFSATALSVCQFGWEPQCTYTYFYQTTCTMYV